MEMKQTPLIGNSKAKKRLYIGRWLVAVLYTIIIFATLPVFPTVWRVLSQNFPRLLNGVTIGLIPGVILVFFVYFILINRKKDLLFYIWAAVFLFSYVPLLYFYCEFPAERFHMAEYGLLVIFVYRALKVRMKTVWIYPAILLYTFFVGFLDEIIQGILPNRAYEFKDITINWVSSFLATGLLAGITWERFVQGASLLRFRRWPAVIISMMIVGHAALVYQKYWRPPLNVIILTVDTFRPDHLGSYGYKRDTTPFLDTIARKGVIFKNVIGSSAWTSPGLISVLTGLYPSVHGVHARGKSLLPGTGTIFKVSKRHGFRVPTISYLSDIANFANLGLDPKDPKYFKRGHNPGDGLLRWLDDHHRDRFTLWYHYRFLHLPYELNDQYNAFLTEKMKSTLESNGVKIARKEVVIPYGTVSFTPEERETIVALYDSQLRMLDHFIKRLYESMTRWKLHRNTLLVITADHGEELFEHGFIGHASTAIHATMYDEVLKIPLIFYAPSCLTGGRAIKEQVRQVDIMPTILDIVGLPIPESIQGVTLMPKIEGKGTGKPLPAVSESVLGGYQSSPEQEKIMLRSLRKDGFKLICKWDETGETCQLFDIIEDPGEQVNLFSIKKGVASRLRAELGDLLAKMQAQRLAMMKEEKTAFSPDEIPKDVKLEKPVLLSPQNREVLRISKEGGHLVLNWTGDKKLTYVIQYDVGKGLRNLKGSIPVQGIRKAFGPLPREAWEPLPYWNPYRIRVSPYGHEKYWSDWVEFYIEGSEKP